MNLVSYISDPASHLSDEFIWKDVNGLGYRLKDIGDRHLMNILNFIYRGGGHIEYTNKKNVQTLYGEALRRGLRPTYSCKEIVRMSKWNARWSSR